MRDARVIAMPPRSASDAAQARSQPFILGVFLAAKAASTDDTAPARLLDDVASRLLDQLESDSAEGAEFNPEWFGSLAHGGNEGTVVDMLTWIGQAPRPDEVAATKRKRKKRTAAGASDSVHTVE